MDRAIASRIPEKFDIEHAIELERSAGLACGPFHRNWLLKNAAPERVRAYMEKAKQFPHIYNAGQSFATMDTMRFPLNAQTAVTASATRTNLWDPTVDGVIPALDIQAGKMYDAKFGGIFTSTGTQGVLTWVPSEGTSGTPSSNHTFGASNATAPAASLTNASWVGEFTFGCYAVDVARTAISLRGSGYIFAQGAAAATGIVYVMGGTNVTNCNNKNATGFVVDLNISVASQSYQCQWTALRSYD